MEHAFTHMKADSKDKDAEQYGKNIADDLYIRVGVWLWNGPFRSDY